MAEELPLIDPNMDETTANCEQVEVTCTEPIEDGTTITNDRGGKQAHVSARMDLIPPECQLLLGECLSFGEQKYGRENWRKIDINDHLNHALVHITHHLNGDVGEMHAVNALARINFALAKLVEEGYPRNYTHPELKGNE